MGYDDKALVMMMVGWMDHDAMLFFFFFSFFSLISLPVRFLLLVEVSLHLAWWVCMDSGRHSEKVCWPFAGFCIAILMTIAMPC